MNEPTTRGLPDDIRPQGSAPNGHHRGPGHEDSDVSTRAIFGFGVGLVVLAAVVVAGLSLLMRGFAAREEVSAALRPALFAIDNGQYPGPNLQDNPAADVIRMNIEDREELDDYGWADRRAKAAQIPIGRAMEILAERGLPTRERPGTSPVAGGGNRP